jgi:pumilio RNA-binding family
VNVDSLINDEFGNFIIQHIINVSENEYNQRIYSYIKDNIVRLSKQKYSSNVLDKCILQEDSLLRTSLIDKMIESKCIGELIVDQYGNYGKNFFKT